MIRTRIRGLRYRRRISLVPSVDSDTNMNVRFSSGYSSRRQLRSFSSITSSSLYAATTKETDGNASSEGIGGGEVRLRHVSSRHNGETPEKNTTTTPKDKKTTSGRR